MTENRLTITIPVYERKDFFLDALNSALNQTVKCEILVIDNCSSHDFFKKICEEKGVNYIKNDTNIGLFPNWNKCMNTALTEFAVILQDDNILEPDFVKCFQKRLNEYPNLDFYFTDFYKIDLSTKIKSDHNHTYPFGYFKNGMKIVEYAAEYSLGLLYSFIIRKSKFTEYYYLFHGSNDWLWIYSNIGSLETYGEKKKLVNYGAHELQDSKNLNTHIQCMLTMSYIYDIVISNNPQLKKSSVPKSMRKASSTFYYFLSITPIIKIKEIINLQSNNIYSEYLNEKLVQSVALSIFVKTPLAFRKLFFKGLRIIGILDKV
jgi:glycosyltransferase involved in cell wall biosynthesis